MHDVRQIGVTRVADMVCEEGTAAQFGIQNHTPAGTAGKVIHQGARVFKYAGRALFVVGAVADVISIAQAEDKVRQTVVVASGFAGAWAGAKLVGAGGAAAGTFIEPGAGTIVVGFLGGIVGGAAGMFGARWAAGKVYDKVERVFTPLPEEKQ